MNKKWMILTCFFSVLTLISSVICSCLVFYNEEARTSANSSKVLATNNIYKSTSIIYNQNNTFNLSGLTPGATFEQSFSITNNNSNKIIYSIEWLNVTSTWNDIKNDMTPKPDEFVYSLDCTNGEHLLNKTMPIEKGTTNILDNLELNTNKTNDCTIKVSFIDKGTDQSYNYNNLFRGMYRVVIKK